MLQNYRKEKIQTNKSQFLDKIQRNTAVLCARCRLSDNRRDVAAGGEEFVEKVGDADFHKAGGRAVGAAEVFSVEHILIDDEIHIIG